MIVFMAATLHQIAVGKEPAGEAEVCKKKIRIQIQTHKRLLRARDAVELIISKRFFHPPPLVG